MERADKADAYPAPIVDGYTVYSGLARNVIADFGQVKALGNCPIGIDHPSVTDGGPVQGANVKAGYCRC